MLPDGVDTINENIEKCLCVGNISANIKTDQVRQRYATLRSLTVVYLPRSSSFSSTVEKW